MSVRTCLLHAANIRAFKRNSPGHVHPPTSTLLKAQRRLKPAGRLILFSLKVLLVWIKNTKTFAFLPHCIFQFFPKTLHD